MAANVVNLLDLRDDEDNKAQGRWANRNPKAKAKGGGRQRRQRNRGGDAASGEQRKSGFGRKESNLSDFSDAGEDEEGAKSGGEEQPASFNAAPGEEGAAPPAAAARAPSPPPAPRNEAAEPLVSNPGGLTPEQLQQAGVQAPLGAIQPFEVEDADEPFAEAKKIANLRRQYATVDPGLQGESFKQNVWEFYMVKGAWADPLCEALNHPKLYLPFFCPLVWPYRLCRTVERAAPLKVKCCCKCQCPLNTCCACPSSVCIFCIPIIAGLTFLPQVATILKDQFTNIPVIKDEPDQDQVVLLTGLVLVVLGLLMMLFWWARILLGVGMKYNISEALNSPDKFVCKAMCCICATNMRVGMHVDRAQGFDKEHKGDRTLIQVSDTIAMQLPPGQANMV